MPYHDSIAADVDHTDRLTRIDVGAVGHDIDEVVPQPDAAGWAEAIRSSCPI